MTSSSKSSKSGAKAFGSALTHPVASRSSAAKSADALAAATIEVANDGHDGEALQNAALRLLVAG